jgi:radical SAM protein with 4Fe4S-binding SPASM domain
LKEDFFIHGTSNDSNLLGVIDPNVARKDEYKKIFEPEEINVNEPPLFSWIEFNLVGLCNRRCDFCPWSNPEWRSDHVPKGGSNNDVLHLPIEVYEGIMKDLNKVGFKGGIIYSAFSEPFLYNHLEEVIKISKKQCPESRIEVVTNGDFLTIDKINTLFKAGLTRMDVSIYDGPDKVKHFQDLRIESGLNKEQFHIRERWYAPEEHFGIGAISNRAGANIMPEINVNKITTALERKCFYPFYQLIVDYDGGVLLCNHDWDKRLSMGNVKETSIIDIWNSKKYKEVRGNLANADRNHSPCDRCDANGMMMGEEFVGKWEEYYEGEKPTKK